MNHRDGRALRGNSFKNERLHSHVPECAYVHMWETKENEQERLAGQADRAAQRNIEEREREKGERKIHALPRTHAWRVLVVSSGAKRSSQGGTRMAKR